MLFHWRVQAHCNAMTAAQDIAVNLKPWRFDTSGKVEFGDELTGATGISETSLATDAEANMTPIDNSTAATKWLGFTGFASCEGAATLAVAGSFDVWLQWSTDATPTWPDDNTGDNLISIPFSTSDDGVTKNRQFKYAF